MSHALPSPQLNKGPYMSNVLSLLDDILGRLSGHEVKKMHLLRGLSIAKKPSSS
jgi:hypothetical protein